MKISAICELHTYASKIYAGRTQSEARRNQHLPSPEPSIGSPPAAGAYKVPVVEEKQVIPDIVPMRRGRPTKNEPSSSAIKPNASPLRGVASDPFVALDTNASERPNVDEISNRFPPLDQFSLLHDSGTTFAFEPSAKSTFKAADDINQRVANALADEAFGQTAMPNKVTPSLTQRTRPTVAEPGPNKADARRNDPVLTSAKEVRNQQLETERPAMVSTGTMTSPPPQEPTSQGTTTTPRPIFKFPPSPVQRPLSQPRASDASMQAAAQLRNDSLLSRRPGLLDHRSKSQVDTLSVSRSPVSSRPSLEGQRPTALELDNSISRSKSASSKTRPASDSVGSKMNFLRGRNSSNGSRPADTPYTTPDSKERSPLAATDGAETGGEATRIDSNVDFLRAMEEEDPSRRKEKRLSGSSKHVKRSSMPSISLTGTKNILAGRFGDAFRRFETNNHGPGQRTSSPSPDRAGRDLTPIAGSEATDGRSDDGYGLDESEEVPPEVRRELERHRLAQEEKRVADAGAAYRQRVCDGSADPRGRPSRPNNRAATIQSKVRSLLDESGLPSPSPTKTAYGRFTESPDRQPPHQNNNNRRHVTQSETQPPSQLAPSNQSREQIPQNPPPPSSSFIPPPNHLQRPSQLPLSQQPTKPPPRPSAPPKPHALRTGTRDEHHRPPSPAKPPNLTGKALPLPPSNRNAMSSPEGDEWETNFSKKYPSLAGLEMVETEIDRGPGSGVKG